MEDFFNCEKDSKSQNIINIDFSHFNSSLITNTNKMLYKCSSLKYLDISNFNPVNLNSSENMFDQINNTEYINIKNLKSEDIKNETKTILNSKDRLIVCQNELIIDNANSTNECCDFSKSPLKCDSNNYITVKYNSEVIYTNGFNIENCQSRNAISYIIFQDSIFF